MESDPKPQNSVQWFLADRKNSKALGPYTAEELIDWISQGHIRPNDYLWSPDLGTQGWKRVYQLEQFVGAVPEELRSMIPAPAVVTPAIPEATGQMNSIAAEKLISAAKPTQAPASAAAPAPEAAAVAAAAQAAAFAAAEKARLHAHKAAAATTPAPASSPASPSPTAAQPVIKQEKRARILTGTQASGVRKRKAIDLTKAGYFGLNNLYRRYPRVPLKSDAIINDEKTYRKGISLDVSEKGLFLRLDESLPYRKGDEVVLTVRNDPDLGTFSVRAVIIRAVLEGEIKGYGLYFLHLNPNIRQKIAKYVLMSLTSEVPIPDEEMKIA
jgi:hypothetical protein